MYSTELADTTVAAAAAVVVPGANGTERNITVGNFILNLTFDEYIFDNQAIRIGLYVVYTAVFCLCFFGNLTVVIVVTFHWRMRSVTKFCMGNLAFANLCVSIFCIYQNLTTFLQENWIFGRFLCKMYYFTNSLSHTASILILVVICVERYLSIVHPLRCRRMLTIQRLRFTIVGVWILSGLLSSPRLYYITTFEIPIPVEPDGHKDVICAPKRTLYDSRLADMAYFVVLFLLPLAVMSVLYSKIGSIIWQSSVALQATTAMTTSAGQGTAMDDPPLDLTAQVIETPRVPHNSIASEFSGGGRHSRAMSDDHETAQNTIRNGLPRCSSSKFLLQTPPAGYHYHHRERHSESSFCENISSSGGKRSDNNNVRKLQTPGGSSDEDRERQRRRISRRSSEFVICLPQCEFSSGTCGDRWTNIFGRTGRKSKSKNSPQRMNICVVDNSKLIAQRRVHYSSSTGALLATAGTSSVLRVIDERRGQVLQSRQAAIRMLIVIVITFAACNFPFHLRKICQYYMANYNLWSSFNQFITPITFVLMYTNCAVNPILYAFMSKNFRSSLKDLLRLKLQRPSLAGMGIGARARVSF